MLIAAFAAIGAAVTVAVATVAMASSRDDDFSGLDFNAVGEDAAWPRTVPSYWPPRPSSEDAATSWGADLILYSEGVRDFNVLVCRLGWPFRSMRADGWWGLPQDPKLLDLHLRTDAIRVERFLVPRRVLWPGFALDTAFYGTLAFLLWSAPGFVKRTRRRRRGLCVACGYESKGMQKCPECGL